MRKGFSLIELMVVVAIIAIISALAIPMYARFVQSNKAMEGSQLILELLPKVELYKARHLAFPDNLEIAEMTNVFNANKGEYFSIVYTLAEDGKRYTITTSDTKKATGGLGLGSAKWTYDSATDSKPNDDASAY